MTDRRETALDSRPMPPVEELTSRLRGADLELWRLICEGRENAAIARRLCLSESAADRKTRDLLQRLGLFRQG